MNALFPPISEFTGPCKSCGTEISVEVPLHLRATDTVDLRLWPQNVISGLFCVNCNTAFPLVPVPVVYWHGDWVAFVPDSPRRASTILQMVASWIADDTADPALQPTSVRVFSTLETLSHTLRQPDADQMVTDVRSRMSRHWDFERIAIMQFADDALRIDAPLVSYSVLAGIVASHSDMFTDQELRDAMQLTAVACGDVRLSQHPEVTPLQHFAQLQSTWDDKRSFRDLDRYQIVYLEPWPPISGSFNCVVQDQPDAIACCDLHCRLLAGVVALRQSAVESGQSLAGALTAEAKALLTLKSTWPYVDEAVGANLREWFFFATNQDLAQDYGI